MGQYMDDLCAELVYRNVGKNTNKKGKNYIYVKKNKKNITFF